MRHLMLLRHAKAVPAEEATDDRARPLAPRGRKDAREIAAYMARHGLVPDRALVSPSKRTRETWEFVAPAFRKPPPAVDDDRLYDATSETIMKVAREQGGDAHRLLVLGHNPGLHKLAMLLIASGEVDLRERLSEALPTSGLVLIEFPFDNWKKLHLHAGRLDRFVTPQSLKEPTD